MRGDWAQREGDVGRKQARRRGRGRALVERREPVIRAPSSPPHPRDASPPPAPSPLDTHCCAGQGLGWFLFTRQSSFLKRQGDLHMCEGPRF